jgi:signal transduction histidine kinase
LSGFIVALGEANRRAQSARHRADELRRTARELAYAVLEKQVKQRAAELEQSNQTLRQLSVRLLQVQDEEARRIARELHDSAGQYLAAVSMALEAVRNEADNLSNPLLRKLEEAAEVTKACTAEIRTISYLLHPPLLEEMGLGSAARWYAEGFAARSGVRVELEIPEELSRMGSEVELVLFRVLQESLTNVHRHSESKYAAIRIGADSQQAWLEIQDQGKGNGKGNGNGEVSSELLREGIGITGMRERVKDLAGVLEITSDQNGTRVKAVIPLAVKPRQVKLNQNTLAGNQFLREKVQKDGNSAQTDASK